MENVRSGQRLADALGSKRDVPPRKGRPLILIAEDESEIVDILAAYLTRAAFRTAHARDGREALELHRTLDPDLILLDVRMPHVDGWEVLRQVRQRGHTPIIMVTAHDEDEDKLRGLEIGADDYVVKPFNPREVVARVEAVLRRVMIATARTSGSIVVGPLELDMESYQVHVVADGQRRAVNLTLTEFRLLAQMARAPSRVFSRAELLSACRSEGDVLERTVDSHISKLRKKLEEAGVVGIPSVLRGVGYRIRSGE